MSAWILPLALLSGLVMSATALSLFALWRAHRLLRQAAEQPKPQSQPEGETRQLRDSVEALAARLRELERNPPVPGVPGVPRPGLNLSKRSQALRMHRQGEPAEQIATALEIPRQEVDLLLKVHKIVIANV